VKEAHALLLKAPGIMFVGNVEGRDILTDDVDVVVTDSFTGNVVLGRSRAHWSSWTRSSPGSRPRRVDLDVDAAEAAVAAVASACTRTPGSDAPRGRGCA
jgi:hypothetical protein